MVKKKKNKIKKAKKKENIRKLNKGKIRFSKKTKNNSTKKRARKKIQEPALFNDFHKTKVKVIGVGGGGGSIVSDIASRVKKSDFVVANTDIQALKTISKKVKKFSFGQKTTKGFGCGMDAKKGEKAAEDEKERIRNLFNGVDLAIFVASLGGGAGSGGLPVFVDAANDAGAITLGIFTLPFNFEGTKKTQIAKNCIQKLLQNLNVLIIVPNEGIFQLIDKKTPLRDALLRMNKILSDNLRGLIETIFSPGLINIDFADVKTIFDGKGKLGYLNAVYSKGVNRAEDVAEKAIQSPICKYDIQGAGHILFNIVSSDDLTMREVEQISKTISTFNPKAKIIFGISEDKNYGNKIEVTLFAVGCLDNAGLTVLNSQKPSIQKKVIKKKKIKEKILSQEPKKNATIEDKEIDKPNISKKDKTDFFKIKLENKKNPKKKKNKGIDKKVLVKSETKNRINEKKISPLSPEKSKSLPLNKGVVLKNELIENKEQKIRKNALDLKRELEETEKKILDREKKWDTPAFLRKPEK
ncbi:MAG: cell division protein FtsZ [Patescibacteria group bacterium]|nr:cell division protein FtsZ [Patescibacteria group bacterium]